MRGAIIEFDDLHKLNWLGERAKLSTVKWWGGALKLALIHGAAVVGLVDAYSNSGRSPRV